MLVANLLFFLRRIVLEGFSRTQNNLEILAGDFKLGRWQKGLLGCCDHFVNPAASFFADVDSSHQGGQIFVSASRLTVYETLSIDQRTAEIEDLDSVFENLQHRTAAADPEILMDQSIRNQFTNDDFRINADLSSKGFANDLLAWQKPLMRRINPSKSTA